MTSFALGTDSSDSHISGAEVNCKVSGHDASTVASSWWRKSVRSAADMHFTVDKKPTLPIAISPTSS